MKRRPLFFWLCWFYSLFFLSVAVCWLLFPDLPRWMFDAPGDDGTLMFGWRVAALVLPWTVALFLARRLDPSPARRAISYGVVTLGVGCALVGAYSILAGIHGPWTWFSVGMEALAAVGFLLAERQPAPRRDPAAASVTT